MKKLTTAILLVGCICLLCAAKASVKDRLYLVTYFIDTRDGKQQLGNTVYSRKEPLIDWESFEGFRAKIQADVKAEKLTILNIVKFPL